jgi:hypothetical protein
MSERKPRDDSELRNAEPGEFREALEGIDFPISKDAIVRLARDKGGIDREVPHVLAQIRDKTYESMSDVEAEIERVYGSAGGLPVGKDAAPP